MATSIVTKVGPADHGRRMSLEEFAPAEGEPGRVYELARGVVVVVDVPGLPHGRIVQAINRQMRSYEEAHPGIIDYLAGGAECALRLPGMQSERHPDQAVYLTPPTEERKPWDLWVPDIVVEVVSEGDEAHERDYQEKREEYLAGGVREYWIVDPQEEGMLVLRRKGDTWQEERLGREGVCRTALLPGFELRLEQIFAAAKGRGHERK